MNDLLPCPFCGHQEPYLRSSQGGYQAECSGGCGGRGPNRFTREEAVAAWNRRVADPAETPDEQPASAREHFDEVASAAWKILGTGRAVSLVVDGEVIGTLEPWGGVDPGAEDGDRSAEWSLS